MRNQMVSIILFLVGMVLVLMSTMISDGTIISEHHPKHIQKHLNPHASKLHELLEELKKEEISNKAHRILNDMDCQITLISNHLHELTSPKT